MRPCLRMGCVEFIRNLCSYDVGADGCVLLGHGLREDAHHQWHG